MSDFESLASKLRELAAYLVFLYEYVQKRPSEKLLRALARIHDLFLYLKRDSNALSEVSAIIKAGDAVRNYIKYALNDIHPAGPRGNLLEIYEHTIRSKLLGLISELEELAREIYDGYLCSLLGKEFRIDDRIFLEPVKIDENRILEVIKRDERPVKNLQGACSQIS